MQGTGVNQEESLDRSREAGANLTAGRSYWLCTDLHCGGDADTVLALLLGEKICLQKLCWIYFAFFFFFIQ